MGDQKHDGEGQEAEPFDEEEQNLITTTLSSFFLYRRASHATLTHRRRQSFYSLPRHQQELLGQQPISYLQTLEAVDDAIENNAILAEAILRSGPDMFGTELIGDSPGWQTTASAEDLDKARSTLKQFYRDWSSEGAGEREKCYGPILNAIEERFGAMQPRFDVKVLVPGAGLGRLAFEIVRRGFFVEGNEFSYHMLMASNFVLNCTQGPGEYVLHPFIHGFSNHRSRGAHLRGVRIPDVHPAEELLREIPVQWQDDQGRIMRDKVKPADVFGMSAGEFVGSYNNPASQGKFDVVATCFFIDTAPNVVRYIETISNTLKPGGVWINMGPLLWHWESSNADISGNKDHLHAEADDDDKTIKGEPLKDDMSKMSLKDNGASSSSESSQKYSQSHSHKQSEGQETPQRVTLELTLAEVIILVEKMGFKVQERRSISTGYIQDDKSMMNYEYEAEFFVATKI